MGCAFLCCGVCGFLLDEGGAVENQRGIVEIEQGVLAELGELLYKPLANQRIAVALCRTRKRLYGVILGQVSFPLGQHGHELLHPVIG